MRCLDEADVEVNDNVPWKLVNETEETESLLSKKIPLGMKGREGKTIRCAASDGNAGV